MSDQPTDCCDPGCDPGGDSNSVQPRGSYGLEADLVISAGQNAPLRGHWANLLRANPDRGSTRGKIKRAAWDDAFLLKILQAA